jgi:hypothetical protein
MGAALSFGRWFGWPPLPHEPAAERCLTLPNIGEKRPDVKVVLCR